MAEIRVGRPDVKPDASAHTKGVPSGNAVGAYDEQVGHYKDGTVDVRQSTGIKPEKRNPIAPSMPNLPPG